MVFVNTSHGWIDIFLSFGVLSFSIIKEAFTVPTPVVLRDKKISMISEKYADDVFDTHWHILEKKGNPKIESTIEFWMNVDV